MRYLIALLSAFLTLPAWAIDPSFSPPARATVLFEYDRTTFVGKGPEIDIHPGDVVTIEAHADCDGNPEYNFRLSDRRAQAVADYLEVDDADILALGETEPAVPCILRNRAHNQPSRRALVEAECGNPYFPCTAAPPDSWLPDDARVLVNSDRSRF